MKINLLLVVTVKRANFISNAIVEHYMKLREVFGKGLSVKNVIL